MWMGMLSDAAYITQEYLQLRWIRVPEKPGDYGVVIVLIQWEHGHEVGCYVSLQRHTERRRLTETVNKCVFVAHTFYTSVGRRWSSCKDNLKDKQLNVKGPLSRKQRSWDEHTHTLAHIRRHTLLWGCTWSIRKQDRWDSGTWCNCGNVCLHLHNLCSQTPAAVRHRQVTTYHWTPTRLRRLHFLFFLILQDMIEQACFFLRTYCYFFSAINLWKLLNKKLLKKKKHLNQCQHH